MQRRFQLQRSVDKDKYCGIFNSVCDSGIFSSFCGLYLLKVIQRIDKERSSSLINMFSISKTIVS